MKIFLSLCLLFASCICVIGQKTIDSVELKSYDSFKLSYISIGFGSNMSELQPRFEINGKKFVYTSEEMWHTKKTKKMKPINLASGYLRSSSIDSIMNFVNEIKGDSVFRLTTGVMSGGMVELSINFLKRKLHFSLHNAFDETAKKIVDILNTYIPSEIEKLWISAGRSRITKIK